MKSKRLKKKYKLGKFAEFGFVITGFSKIDDFLDYFIDVVESNNYVCCGGTNNHETGNFEFIVWKPHKYCSIIVNEMNDFKNKLGNCIIKEIKLVDINHGI